MEMTIVDKTKQKNIDLINKLLQKQMLDKVEFVTLLNSFTKEISQYLYEVAREVSKKHFGNKIYSRGLIEFTNYCKNDCYYCGIRRSNSKVERYRLNYEDIMNCCRNGYALGFRTFVLQGGEDLNYTDEDIVNIVSSIKKLYPDCAVTLSIGEKSYESYLKYFQNGADRYLLRHETSNEFHYGKLHPKELTISNRKRCLLDLKKIGYQVGTGIMVGSPYQTVENIVEDLLFMKELNPQMIGIGPYIPHHDTPFSDEKTGSLDLTLFLIGILRLMFPNALIPATTSLGTVDPNGREKGILAGANVVMPNLSPVNVRKKYELYDNKICTGEEAAECKECLSNRMKKIGYEIVVDRGDFVQK
ncbi:biotin synthase [Sedimentibacter acidaminivorans]|uniref:Biotin synthase n=1 Tax=Sedimentibacter acidaminivorans TaxID=913099 RepID=A0ABS4GEF2_9FIRM|nr:[FeFe] hydrogenase H-cluster radical SAM maturase HydE [Sedimentibacter acidaminivorans]MBP1926073.1 biotin synthase [Sedimentibacter acidaminivorans]